MALILSGPIVRRVDPSSCSVFVALSAPSRVELLIYAPGGEVPVMHGARDTVRLGEGLHVAVVTAAGGPALRWGGRYEYDLRFSGGKAAGTLHSPGILYDGPPADDLDRLCYPGHARPGFALAPEDPARLRVLHGSCRKPHGNGDDALVHADTLLAEACDDGAVARPQLLVLSGDQIYGDDVHPALLASVRRLAHQLFGRHEEADDDVGAVVNAPSRQEPLALAGITSSEAACHLVTLGEYCAAYLHAWSDTVWDRAAAAEPALAAYHGRLRRVRRALANVSTFMIFDDHEITDDWYIRRTWCDRVLGAPLGQRIVRNGLCAYALFQHWGNAPADLAQPGPGGELLAAVEGWSGTTQDPRHGTLERLLGIPKDASGLGAPGSLRWSYRYPGPGFELIALDTRSRRQFSGRGVSLMSAADIDAALPPSAVPLTLVISPAPVLGLEVIERVQKLSSRFDGGIKLDDEPWGHSETYAHLRDRLLGRRRVVVLSGDVHYGYWALLTRGEERVVNFVASALKNSPLGKRRAPPDIEPLCEGFFAGPGEDVDIGWASLAFSCHLAEVGFDPARDRVRQTQWFEQHGAWQRRTQELKFPL